VWGICRSAVFNSLFLLQKKQFVLLLIRNEIRILLLCFTSYIFCLCTSYMIIRLAVLCMLCLLQMQIFIHMEPEIEILCTWLHADWTYGNTVFVFGPKLWNCLPLNIRNPQSIYSFKRHYKSILIDNIVD